MTNPKILLSGRHIEWVGSDMQHCVNYTLSEEVEGQLTGDVGETYASNLTDDDVLEQLKQLVVDDINGKQSTYTFDQGDIVTWEA